MSLRTRFIIILFLLCLAVGVNIHVATWCNQFLLADAMTLFAASQKATYLSEDLNNDLRRQERALLAIFEQGSASAQQRQEVGELLDIMELDIRRLGYLSEALPQTFETGHLKKQAHDHAAYIRDYLAMAPGTSSEPLPEIQAAYRQKHGQLLDELQTFSAQVSSARKEAAVEVRSVSDVVNLLLAGMAAVEVVILLIVLTLFRGWMIHPIEKIRTAAEQIASGNLDYRLKQHSSDELGALANEVNHMAASLSRAQKELKRNERMAAVGEMVSVVAHNIRNPLAGIRATAQACKNDAQHDSAFFSQQDRIMQTVDSLEQWLKELLHLNRHLELKCEATKVDLLVEDLQKIFQPTIQRKNVSIVYAPETAGRHIRIDRQHFVQALSSILDNAIEASIPGSAITIRTSCGEDADDTFCIDVSNCGAGVPTALRRQIFEPYFSTKPGGTGIGLSMAKKIVEAHAGRITVTDGLSGERSTTTFRISIPNAAAVNGQNHG